MVDIIRHNLLVSDYMAGLDAEEKPSPSMLKKIEQMKIQAERRGFEVGHALGVQQGLDDYNKKISELSSFIEAFKVEMLTANDKFKPVILSLSLKLTQILFRYECTLQPAIIESIVNEALNDLPEAALNVKIHLNSADIPFVKMQKDFNIISDNKITKGGCLIECDIANIDARVETRLAQLSQELK